MHLWQMAVVTKHCTEKHLRREAHERCSGSVGSAQTSPLSVPLQAAATQKVSQYKRFSSSMKWGKEVDI